MLILNAQKLNIVNQGFFFFFQECIFMVAAATVEYIVTYGIYNWKLFSGTTSLWTWMSPAFFTMQQSLRFWVFLFFFVACNIFSRDCFVIAGCAMYFSANTLSKNSATRNQLMLIENIKTCDLHRSVFDIFYFFFHILEICKVYKFMHKILGWWCSLLSV